jgi:hypothetical protein
MSQTIYVNPNVGEGNDAWTGENETNVPAGTGPKETITSALSASSSGDIISLAAGTYSGYTVPLTNSYDGYTLTFQGSGEGLTIIDTDLYGIALIYISSVNATFNFYDMTFGTDAGISGYAIRIAGNSDTGVSTTFNNCTFGTSNQAPNSGGILVSSLSPTATSTRSVVIDDCTIYTTGSIWGLDISDIGTFSLTNSTINCLTGNQYGGILLEQYLGNITINDSDFVIGGTNASYGVRVTSPSSLTSFTMSRNNMSCDVGASVGGVLVSGPVSTELDATILFEDNIIDFSNSGVTTTCVRFGHNYPEGNPFEQLGAGIFRGNEIIAGINNNGTSVNHHGFNLGYGMDGSSFYNNTISARLYALPIRSSNCEFYNNIIYGRVWFKGALDCNFHNNTIFALDENVEGGSKDYALEISVDTGITPNKESDRITVLDNILDGSDGVAPVLLLTGSSMEGCIFNNNCYGDVTNVADIKGDLSTLEEWQSWWSANASTDEGKSNSSNGIVADPLLDSAYAPQNPLVISGGTPDNNGNLTTIGAVQVRTDGTSNVIILDKPNALSDGTLINDVSKSETDVSGFELTENLTISDKTVTNLPAYLLKSGGTVKILTSYPTYDYSQIPTGNIIGKLNENVHAEIRYTINGKTPTRTSHLYKEPIVFDQFNLSGSDNTILKYKVFYQGKASVTKTIKLRIV